MNLCSAVQESTVHPHCPATLTTIHVENFPIFPREGPYPLNTNSPFSPAPGHRHSFCLCNDYSCCLHAEPARVVGDSSLLQATCPLSSPSEAQSDHAPHCPSSVFCRPLGLSPSLLEDIAKQARCPPPLPVTPAMTPGSSHSSHRGFFQFPGPHSF